MLCARGEAVGPNVLTYVSHLAEVETPPPPLIAACFPCLNRFYSTPRPPVSRRAGGIHPPPLHSLIYSNPPRALIDYVRLPFPPPATAIIGRPTARAPIGVILRYCVWVPTCVCTHPYECIYHVRGCVSARSCAHTPSLCTRCACV